MPSPYCLASVLGSWGPSPTNPTSPSRSPGGRGAGWAVTPPRPSQPLPRWAGRRLGSQGPPPQPLPATLRGRARGLTRTMWPVEMSMLGCTGSSDQDEVLLRAEGLGMGPSLNWEDTLLTRDVCAASGRSVVRTAMR